MTIECHLSDCEDETNLSVKPETHGRFVLADIYGADITLDTQDYDNGADFINVPCPYGEDCTHCGKRPRHMDAIFMAIDGACRGNGSAGARSSYGIYFSECSPYNVSSTMQGSAQSSQKAELQACLKALVTVQLISGFVKSGSEQLSNLSQVIIKADSDYVVRGMTEYILKWRQNGFKNAKGQPVVNAWMFRMIDAQVERLDACGVKCLFWHVSRSQNQEADRLANLALDEAMG